MSARPSSAISPNVAALHGKHSGKYSDWWCGAKRHSGCSGVPWLALVLTSVAGLKLGTWCARKAHLNAVYIWMYANNWDWSLFEIPGFRHELSRNAAAITFFWLGIGLGAWTLGRILQWTSRDTAPVQAVIFTVLLFAAPTDPLIVLVNPPVFAHWYYRALPLIIKTMLVMLPCWRGMRTRRVA